MDPKHDRAARTFDSYNDSYSEAVDAAVSFTGLKTNFFTRVKAEYLLDLSRAHFGSAANLAALDVGCGVGNFHSLLAPHLGRLSGVDVSSACIDTARTRNTGVDYQVYDGGALPYPDASFDLAFAICVIHHVPPKQWEQFVEEMHRVLRPGALALVFEHNPRNPLTIHAVKSCPFDEDAVLLRNEVAENLFRNSGFKQVDSRFILSVPPLNGFFRRVDRLFGRVPFGAQYYVVATA